jgi:hypothetical protein
MKNSNDYRTRVLPACSAEPQPTPPPRAPSVIYIYAYYFNYEGVIIHIHYMTLVAKCVIFHNRGKISVFVFLKQMATDIPINLLRTVIHLFSVSS